MDKIIVGLGWKQKLRAGFGVFTWPASPINTFRFSQRMSPYPAPKKARGKAPDKIDKSSSDDYSDEVAKPGMCTWVKYNCKKGIFIEIWAFSSAKQHCFMLIDGCVKINSTCTRCDCMSLSTFALWANCLSVT